MLLAECRQLGGCPTVEAKITPGYDLRCRWVIHTVGPVWRGGARHEDELLACCYRNSLKLAQQNVIKTIAFPSISTGAYRFPFQQATLIAVREIQQFFKNNPQISLEQVILVAYTQEDYHGLQQVVESSIA
ncbi:macro domain-containing protein [Lyngbya sp. PCC 8106]|uniref:macro domain-containing protein n=1 Tax=Lyngbya sp. (strain PCC 8106) TaxID=313612 RepID=UPI0018DE97AB|nr:macro domain-containing protein [Lyngbya sp. PCC 8106]